LITDASVAQVAALLADPTRLAILFALADGRPRPAGELARHAGVRASTASEHLAQLLAGELVAVERHGRHRYYRIAGESVVVALESLGTLARPARPKTFQQTAAARTLRHARACYDHLAGRLGVEVTRSLVESGALILQAEAYELTHAGTLLLGERLGLDIDRARATRRSFARACLDWTERSYHLAGALGAELLHRLLALDWLERDDGSRALRVTPAGRRGFREHFGIDPLASRWE
jgi:DNA-binding transcriptional ArsR family regulator